MSQHQPGPCQRVPEKAWKECHPTPTGPCHLTLTGPCHPPQSGPCEPTSTWSMSARPKEGLEGISPHLVEHAVHARDRPEVPLLANGVDVLRVCLAVLPFLVRTLIKLQLAGVTVDHSGKNCGPQKLPFLFEDC